MRNRPARPHILQLITTLDPGGAENQLLRLCSALADRFRFTVAYFKGAGGLAPRFEALAIPVHSLRVRGWVDPFCLHRLRRLRRRLGPDLVVTHLFKADVYGAAALLGAGVPLVSHKHNEDLYLLNPFFGALGRLAARRAWRLVAVSHAVARFFTERAGFPAGKFVRILHGIPLADGTRPATSGVRREMGLAPGDRVVGTVARLAAQKGVATLLRAVRILVERDDRYRCLIVGEGEDESPLRDLSRSLGLERHVRFAGRRTDVPAVLAALDVFVLPSRWEGFGVVLLEAMAHGCPVVASRVGGIPEVVDDGLTGRLVPAGDPDALAAAIHELVTDEPRRGAMVEAGRRALVARFTVERMAAETAALYEAALQTPRPRPAGAAWMEPR